jgi:hypothetical protein
MRNPIASLLTAMAEPAAVLHMIRVKPCSLMFHGPGLMYRKTPLDGKNLCMASPIK